MKDLLRRGLALLMSVVMSLSLFVGYLPTEAFADLASNVIQVPARERPEPKAPEPKITITSNRKNNTLDYIGDTLTLTATLENAPDAEFATKWSSSDSSVATVEKGVVTARNFHPTETDLRRTVTITVTMTELSEGDAEEKVYEGSWEVVVQYSIQPLFYYALIPEHDETVKNGNGDSDWFGIGVELIAGAKPATGESRDVGNLQYQWVGVRKPLYPEIEYNGKTYTHNSTTGNGYTLDQFRIVSDSTAHGGFNKYNVYDGRTDPAWTYHVDHRLNFTEPGDYCNVHFMVKYPEEQIFTLDKESMQNVKKGTAESEITRPDSSSFPDKEQNGIVYTFKGWYTDEDCSVEAEFQGTITGNTKYYGLYEATQAKYTVRFFYDGHENQAKAEHLTGNIGDTIRSSDAAIGELVERNTISGYTYTNTTPESITLTAGGTNEIHILYTKHNVTVSYDVAGRPAGVNNPSGGSYKLGDLVSTAKMDVPGYDFSGWTTNDIAEDKTQTSVTPGATFTMPGNNVTLKGTLTPKTDTAYKVEHYQQNINDNGYTLADTDECKGETGTTATAVEKDYPGFTLNPGAKNARPSGTITGDGKLVLRLYYDRNKNDVTYQLTDDSAIPKGMNVDALGETGVKYEARKTVARTEYEGYKFSGWSTSDLSEEKYDGGEIFTMPDHDVTFTGKFTAQPFDVEYVINGEDHSLDKKFPKTETRSFEETVTVAPAPECEAGYRFIGWTTEDVEVGANNQFQMPNKKVTLTGTFEPIECSYTVNYYLGGTEEQYQTTIKVKDSDTKSANFGEQIRLDPNKLPVIEGYTLATTEDQSITIGVDENANVINVYYYKDVTVKAADNGKMYGEADPALTAAVDESGLVSGDTSEKITFNAPARESGEDVDTYEITVGGEEIQGYYKVTYEPGVFTIRASSTLTVAGRPYDEVYDGNAYGEEATVSGGPTRGVKVEYSTDGGENWSKDFPTVTDVADSTEVMVRASAENYVTAENTYTLKVTKRAVLLDGNQETVPYDGEKHSVSGVEAKGVAGNADSGLVGTHTLVGADFAVTDKVNAGTYPVPVDVTEVKIMDGTRDVTANYEVTAGRDVKLTISPLAITIKPKTVSRTYDGNAYGATEFEYVGSGRPIEGDTLSVISYGGAFTEAGTYTGQSSIGNCTITNDTGDVTGNYTVTKQPGDIVISKRVVTLTSATASKTYDGTPLTNESVTVGGDGFVEGQEPTYSFTGTQTNAGSSANSFDYNRADYTKNYNISESTGTLTVNPASLTVQTMSADRVYNGEALTNGNVVIKLGNEQETVETKAGKTATVKLPNGETIGIMVTGTQTEAGSSPNTAVISWNGSSNGSFTALESNYILSFEYGQLTVTDSEDEIVVTTTGGVFTYDGLPHRATVAVSELPEGYTLERAESDAVAQTVLDGTVEAKCDRLVIKNAQGVDVTNTLKIRYVNSRLLINPTPLNITTQSATKEYDGEPLTAGVTVTGLVNNETVSVMPTGSQTEVGSSKNGYHIAWVGTAKVYNYDVDETLGTLTVTAVGVPPVPPTEEDDTPDVRVVETLLLEDEIVPLAGGTEKCCILHFLLALVSLVTVLISGHDTKKLQEKITELKKKESPENGEDDGRADGRKDDD